jgi:hypothetical protein
MLYMQYRGKRERQSANLMDLYVGSVYIFFNSNTHIHKKSINYKYTSVLRPRFAALNQLKNEGQVLLLPQLGSCRLRSLYF